jgi:hypothetical protein
VVEKRAEVAVAQQRTFEEDVAIAAIPAVLAAGKSKPLCLTRSEVSVQIGSDWVIR